MGFLGTLEEKLRDKRRDELCASLCAIGIDARMAERGRAEEKIGGKGSLGVIDISGGSIRWVNVREELTSGGYSPGSSGSIWSLTDYGVPDPRVQLNLSGYEINTVLVKTFPLFGRVVDLRWKCKDYGLRIVSLISRLNSDISLKSTIMGTHDVKIIANGEYGCWIISTQTRDVPSRELWDCYQKIAKHLLAEWSLSV